MKGSQSLQSQGDISGKPGTPGLHGMPLLLPCSWGRTGSSCGHPGEQIFAKGGDPRWRRGRDLDRPLHSFSFRSNFKTDKTDRSDSASVTREQSGKLRPAGFSLLSDTTPSACIPGKATCLPHSSAPFHTTICLTVRETEAQDYPSS